MTNNASPHESGQGTAAMLPLAERLRERIRQEGSITFRDWMEAALYDEREGYYMRPGLKRWGRPGDYRTAPERSTLFGATFANYFAKLYAELGSPSRWTIYEAGAGAGHFAESVLGALRRQHPRVFTATRYVIDDVSSDAGGRACTRLEEFKESIQFGRLDDSTLSAMKGIVFANELLDAFPVHRVVRRGQGLLELYVGLDKEGRFVWEERELSTARLASYFHTAGVELSEGQVAEVNLAATEWVARAASAIGRGYLIMVDYGAEAPELYGAPHRRAGTLRAFRGHRLEDDILTLPGEQDLTTTVDWTSVRAAGESMGLHTVVLERQGEFLLKAGLLDILEREAAATKSEAEVFILRSGVRELILPGGMSDSFQVLVLEKATKEDDR